MHRARLVAATRASLKRPQLLKATLPCTCNAFTTSQAVRVPRVSPIVRTYASAATATKPVEEAVIEEDEEEQKPSGPPKPLPQKYKVTADDHARLDRLRNVGISAHIEFVLSLWSMPHPRQR